MSMHTLAGAMLTAMIATQGAAAVAAAVAIDYGYNDGGANVQVVQAGFTEGSLPKAYGNPASMTTAVSPVFGGVSYPVDVTVLDQGGDMESRNRAAVSGTSLDDVHRDFVAARADMAVTISGLPTGVYQWTAYHNDGTGSWGNTEIAAKIGTTTLYTSKSSIESGATDDASIGTSRFTFNATEGQDVVVDLDFLNPPPSGNPLGPPLNGLTLERLVAASVIAIDYGQTGQAVQPGFTEHSLPNISGNGLSATTSVTAAMPGSPSVDVTVTSDPVNEQIETRNRTPAVSGTTLNDVYSDFFASRAGHLSITLSGLTMGRYQWTGYHNDSGSGFFGTADLSVGIDGTPVDSLVSTHQLATNDWAIGKSFFTFDVAPENDIVIDFYRSSGNAIALNGFQLDLMVVPEPSSLLLSVLGLLGLAVLAYRRRRSQD